MNKSKGSAAVIVLILAVLVGAGYYVFSKKTQTTSTESNVGYKGDGEGYAGASKGGYLCADCGIAVIYPNGGETFKIGSRVNIEWATKPELRNQPVMIVLHRKDETATSVIARNVPNTGNYSWSIPTPGISAPYVITVSVVSPENPSWNENPNSDVSDAPFILTE